MNTGSAVVTDPISLENTVALVTGAGSGLGEATARAFAGAGSTIVLVDRNAGAIDRVREQLSAGGPGDAHIAVPCDISDAEAVQGVVDDALARLGRIDIVVNCAAVDHTYWVEQLTIEQWDQVLDVNLRGPFLVAKAV